MKKIFLFVLSFTLLGFGFHQDVSARWLDEYSAPCSYYIATEHSTPTSYTKPLGTNTLCVRQNLRPFDGHSINACPGNPSITTRDTPPNWLSSAENECYICNTTPSYGVCDSGWNWRDILDTDGNIISGEWFCASGSYTSYARSCNLRIPGHTTLLDGTLFQPGSYGYAKNQECGNGGNANPNLMVWQLDNARFRWDDVIPYCIRAGGFDEIARTDFISDAELDIILESLKTNSSDQTVTYMDTGRPYTGIWTNRSLQARGLCADDHSGCKASNPDGVFQNLRYLQRTFNYRFDDIVNNTTNAVCDSTVLNPTSIRRGCVYELTEERIDTFITNYGGALSAADRSMLLSIKSQIASSDRDAPRSFASNVSALRSISYRYGSRAHDQLYTLESGSCQYTLDYDTSGGGVNKGIPPLIDRIIPTIRLTGTNNTRILDNESNNKSNTGGFYAGSQSFIFSITDSGSSLYAKNQPNSKWVGYHGISGISLVVMSLTRTHTSTGLILSSPETVYSNGVFINTEYNKTGAILTPQNISITVDLDDTTNIRKSGRYKWDIITMDRAGNRNDESVLFDIYAKLPPEFEDPSYTISIDEPGSTVDDTNIANGLSKTLLLDLKDKYENPIIPVSSLGRTVDISLNIENSLYMNQQSRSGDSSVFLSSLRDPSTRYRLPIGNPASIIFPNEVSTINAQYQNSFFVYTPTRSGYTPADGKISDPNANLALKRILATVRDISPLPGETNTERVVSSNVNLETKYRPLYVSRYSGDLSTGGFIEGAIQESTVGFTQNGPDVPSQNHRVELQYSGDDVTKFKLFGGANSSNVDTNIARLTLTLLGNISGFKNTAIDLYTRLIQEPNAVGRVSSIDLSSHLSYTLEGHDIKYNSDVIGKTVYFGTAESLGFQNGVKIIGNTRSKSQKDITAGQSVTDIQLLQTSGTIADLLNEIRRVMTISIRGTPIKRIIPSTISNINIPPTGGSLSGSYITKNNSDVTTLYIEGRGDTITLANLSGLRITGKKTIIVNGGNIYIKNNMYYNGSGSIIGIIALTDKSNRGGNIYIDPSVTNIVGTLVAQKAVISYDGTRELGGDTSISTLKNQLYIYGSIISKNTIGGSRKSTPLCPKFHTGACTEIVAQKYDLNFLRRYYLTTIGANPGKKWPFGNAQIAGGGSCNIDGICTGWDTNLRRKFTNTTEEFASYPIIMEYNPAILSNPPPIFSEARLTGKK